MNIYVGNLSFNHDEGDLFELFENIGQVDSVRIITDRETGRSKGFGFVEMADEAQAIAAIEQLNGTEFGGNMLTVGGSLPSSLAQPLNNVSPRWIKVREASRRYNPSFKPIRESLVKQTAGRYPTKKSQPSLALYNELDLIINDLNTSVGIHRKTKWYAYLYSLAFHGESELFDHVLSIKLLQEYKTEDLAYDSIVRQNKTIFDQVKEKTNKIANCLLGSPKDYKTHVMLLSEYCIEESIKAYSRCNFDMYWYLSDIHDKYCSKIKENRVLPSPADIRRMLAL
jgi:RNA recognition motif-containing protein